MNGMDQQPAHTWTPGDRITHNGTPGVVFEVDDLGGIGYYADAAPINHYTGQTCPTYLSADQAATAEHPTDPATRLHHALQDLRRDLTAPLVPVVHALARGLNRITRKAS